MDNQAISFSKNYKLNSFLEKFHGAYYGITVGIMGLIILVICPIIYNLTEPVPMNYVSHWVSNLGIAYSGTYILFNISLIALIFLAVPFMLNLIREMLINNHNQKRLFIIPLLFSLITVIGGIGVVLFPMDKDPKVLHATSAVTFFFGAGFMILSICTIMIRNKNIPLWQGSLVIIPAIPLTILLSFYFPLFMDGANFVDLVTSLDPSLAHCRLFEWLSVYGMIIWFILFSLTWLYQDKKDKKAFIVKRHILEKFVEKVVSIPENKKLGRFLDRFNGGYFGILAGIILLVMLGIGPIVYFISEEPITMFSHWISNMGSASNGAQYFFSTCMVLIIIFCIPFLLGLFRKMYPGNNKQRKAFVIPLNFLLFSVMGGIGLTIFNMYDFPPVHVVFAVTFFMSCALMISSISIIMTLNKELPFWLIQSAASFIVVIPILIMSSILMIKGGDVFTLLISMSPDLGELRLWEWLSAFGIAVWFIETGVFLIKMK